MQPRDALKLEIMDATKYKEQTVYDIGKAVTPTATVSQIARAIDELMVDGYLVIEDESTTGHLYGHKTETSLSDLRAKLLPHRDPVREAHAHQSAQGSYRIIARAKDDGADLPDDD